MTESRLPYLLIATFVGILSATQARINGSLGAALHSGVHAATASFTVGFALLALITLLSRRARTGTREVLTALRRRDLPTWALLGGALGTVFVLSQSVAVPSIGVAVFMTCMVLGQLVGSLLVDALGLFGAPRKPVSAMRMSGAACTAGAVLLIGWGSEVSAGAVGLLVMAVVSGVALSFQMAVTGLVNTHAGEPVAPALVNFFVGSVLLAAAAVVAQLLGWVDARVPPQPNDWWLYLGGACGVAYLLVVAAVVRQIGVFLLTLAVVAGQLIGALLWDLVGGHVRALVLIGLPLAFAGIVVANLGSLRRR